MTYLWVAIGSALGGVARYWLSDAIAMRIGGALPWGTIIVNVTGSFVIGCFAALTAPEGRFLVDPTTRVFVMVRLCGGYTTFSPFSPPTLDLARHRPWLYARAHILYSGVLCLLAGWLPR